MRFAPILRTSAMLLTSALVFAGAANAQTVTLMSQDRSLSITGELLSFDGKTYVIRGMLGDVSLDTSRVVCVSDNCPALVDDTKFTVLGSPALGNALMPNMIQFFALQQDMNVSVAPGTKAGESVFTLTKPDGSPYVEITVDSTSSDAVAGALQDGSAAIGMLTAPLTAAQKQAMARALGTVPNEPAEIAVALDGMAFVVSPNNPVNALTEKQIAGIYAGTITNWAEVGGPDLRIDPYLLDKYSGPESLFSRNLMTARGLTYSRNVRPVADLTNLDLNVSGDPGAIGFVSIGDSTATKVLALRGECGILSKPDTFTVGAEEYPETSRLYLVDSGAERSAPVQAFLDFVASDAAQAAVENAGFVGDSIATRALDAQGNRLLDMILTDQETASLKTLKQLAKELRGATRVSTTFRFVQGISKLDARNTRALAGLARYFEGRDMTGKEILVVGFTDSVGSAKANASLSRRRAEFVAGERVKVLGQHSAGINIVAKGYGEASPLDCNTSERGRNINRRVEIWVRDAR